MSRLSNAILTGQFVNGVPMPMLDPRIGGQQGFGPSLTSWVSNQAYVQRPIIPVLLEAPKFFRYLPDFATRVGILKAMVELHAKQISGLNSTHQVDFNEQNTVSGGGEVQQEIINVTRERSHPQFTWIDKYGRPFQQFLLDWITYGGMDPDTKVPNIATLVGNIPTDMLADISTMTCLFFEPDPTHQFVNKAWLCANMFPKTAGDVTGKRDLTSAMDTLELNIEFSALTQTGLGVRNLAQTIFDSMTFTNANPNLAPAFLQGVEADVLAQGVGYAVGAAQASASAIATRG